MGLTHEPDMPKKWIDEINADLNNDPATNLSMHRTYLSTARSHMSNERTHLAYLRTALALISFGITLNRFSIFLRESDLQTGAHGILTETEFVGLGIVLVGLTILAWSLRRFKKVHIAIETDNYQSSERPIRILTFVILLLGGLTTLWMFTSRG